MLSDSALVVVPLARCAQHRNGLSRPPNVPKMSSARIRSKRQGGLIDTY
jgi:hypothetical protein